MGLTEENQLLKFCIFSSPAPQALDYLAVVYTLHAECPFPSCHQGLFLNPMILNAGNWETSTLK